MSGPERCGGGLDGAEAHELFSLYLAHGMRPPEIHPQHPLVTGAQKLAAMQDEKHPRFSTPLPNPERLPDR